MGSRRAILVLVSVLLLAAGPARAQSVDPFTLPAANDGVIVLRDGSILRGAIVERVEGDHVTIRLDDGQLRRVAWSSIQPREPLPSAGGGAGVSPLTVLCAIGGVGFVGGGGTLIGSLFVHDDATRARMQIGGGIALGAGLTLVIVAGAVGFSRGFSVVR